ncbi:MAG TPA: serine hydrolase [Pyrinomonadaceae bacterium]|nr:serine hydrolase [Pyrinomonadaceae bacterium]
MAHGRTFVPAFVLALALGASVASTCGVARAQPRARASAPRITPVASREIQAVVDAAVREGLRKFADRKLAESQLAVTVIDLADPDRPAQGSFRGDARIYPASVVKLFYLAAAHRRLEDGEMRMTPELGRALRDMIVDSSNDATGYVLDALTGTSSGVELEGRAFNVWQGRRNWVNRYFASLGYANINVNQKTVCEDAYGREKQSRGPGNVNHNRLTTNATARLLAEIATGRAVSPSRSLQMMELLKRDYAGKSDDTDDQAHGFTGIALKDVRGARLWSKAGWTSTTRHDAAYVELPGGARLVVVTFTEQQSRVRDIIPTIAEVVIDKMRK